MTVGILLMLSKPVMRCKSNEDESRNVSEVGPCDVKLIHYLARQERMWVMYTSRSMS